MILTVRSSSSPQVATTAIPKTAASITTPAADVYDSEILTTTGATAWNEFALEAASLEDGVEFSTTTSGVCAVSAGGYVSRVASGIAVIYAAGTGPSRKKLVLDMRDTGGQTLTEFAQYADGSMSDLCATETLTRLAGGGQLNYYSSVNHDTPAYPRNASCWLADVDLSPVSVANRDSGGSWGHHRAGTFITRRHVVFANHYAPSANAEIRVTNPAGTVFTHTVLGYHGASTGADVLSDLKVAVVTPALDASITPMKVAGPWIMQGLTPSGATATYYMGGVAVWIDQEKDCYASHIGNRTTTISSSIASGTFNSSAFTDIVLEGKTEFADSQIASPYLESYSGFVKIPISGDSGSPVMLIIGGEPVLLWVWFTSLTGTPAFASTSLLNARIAAADTAAGISTGLTVTVATDPTL